MGIALYTFDSILAYLLVKVFHKYSTSGRIDKEWTSCMFRTGQFTTINANLISEKTHQTCRLPDFFFDLTTFRTVFFMNHFIPFALCTWWFLFWLFNVGPSDTWEITQFGGWTVEHSCRFRLCVAYVSTEINCTPFLPMPCPSWGI